MQLNDSLVKIAVYQVEPTTVITPNESRLELRGTYLKGKIAGLAILGRIT